MPEGSVAKLVENVLLLMIWTHWSFDVQVIEFCQNITYRFQLVGICDLAAAFEYHSGVSQIAGSDALLGIGVTAPWLVSI